MPKLEGHELAVIGTLTGLYGITSGTLGPGWVKSFIHRQPVAAMSVFLGTVGIVMPLVIVPIRRALKLPTNQYDASNPNVVFPKYD
mmetsp:Transcript_37033/g.52321  ORF Transcript_37033/g.52321 Transcript_37033/m.52321 type:complete len:86 (+) Transcript_37033:61-318(+)|eukprot:CAMPEP_0202447352 /NCGR_PEP_ID=MMETSP1360-20130828/6116_1 /ASSEMBLY_ACC=CAM_ASM_000848 /TAXON_ID=515479 /ORGANISM="Licmophora paradoxa, Strain CCMP2313" /LENGTH=85 /DNA_ID=CAMNT_0049064407 /DNA_START=81 /DNA_END=338 /DNA_ORIENTATION=+